MLQAAYVLGVPSAAELPKNRYVLRTDVKDYCGSLDHFRLLEQLASVIREPPVLNLFWQSLNQPHLGAGRAASTGSADAVSPRLPLEPRSSVPFISAASTPHEPPQALLYVRFMDHIAVLAPSRRKLRRAVRELNATFAALGLEKHPGKTTIGPIARGFDFPGAQHLTPKGPHAAQATPDHFLARAPRLGAMCAALPPGRVRFAFS